MKVSFVTANLNSGGAERVISLLANEFDRHDYEVEIIFLKERIVFYPINKDVQIVVADEECYSTSMWRKMWWFRKYIKKTNPDVIIPFRVSVYTTTLLSLLGISIPIISSERIDPHIPDPFWNLLRMMLLPFTAHLVVQTNYIKSYYPKFIQQKTSVISNPVLIHNSSTSEATSSMTQFFDKRSDFVDDTIHNAKNRIVSVARLAPQKNQKMMIEAFAEIAPRFPDWQLVIFGEGPLRAELEELVSSFMLQDRVLLPGRTEHVMDELRKSKIFCFSSDYEGQSNSVIEAVSVGLPIVTTRVSGMEDFIVDGENGFLVPVGDKEAMKEALLTLMQDEKMMENMGERNLQKASMFNMKNIFQQWENLIQNIVKEAR